MGIRRYTRCPVIGINYQYGTSRAIQAIRNGINNGTIKFDQIVIGQDQRLDSIAGERYGDSRDWWIIAAASGIGWGLQVPADTILIIPNRNDISEIIE